MTVPRDEPRYANPYLAGALLGVVLGVSFIITGHGLQDGPTPAAVGRPVRVLVVDPQRDTGSRARRAASPRSLFERCR